MKTFRFTPFKSGDQIADLEGNVAEVISTGVITGPVPIFTAKFIKGKKKGNEISSRQDMATKWRNV